MSENNRNRFEIFFALISLTFLFSLGYRLNERNTDAQLKLQGLILKSIRAAETEYCVSTDEDGIIDWCNTRFERKFGVGVGDPLVDIMPEELAEGHLTACLRAIARHKDDHPAEFAKMDCEALDKRGNRIPVEISAWTTDTGVIGFLRLPKEMKSSEGSFTGELANRGAWMDYVEKVLKEDRPALSFPRIDVDAFTDAK